MPASTATVSQTATVNARSSGSGVSAIATTNVACRSTRTGDRRAEDTLPSLCPPFRPSPSTRCSTVTTPSFSTPMACWCTAAVPCPARRSCSRRLNRDDKPYFIVTNDASKLPATAASRYQRFGLPIDASRILTSGMLLTGHFADRGLRGRRCAVLGPADSARYVADAGGEVVPPDEAFDVLVIGDESGFPFLDWADAALSSLFVSIRRGPAGPPRGAEPGSDLPGRRRLRLRRRDHRQHVRGRARRFGIRIGRNCASRGLGKPNTPIFEDAVRRLGTSRAVMVGDTLETDIAGARAAGLDAVWIRDRCHRGHRGRHAGAPASHLAHAGPRAHGAGERRVSDAMSRPPDWAGGAGARSVEAEPGRASKAATSCWCPSTSRPTARSSTRSRTDRSARRNGCICGTGRIRRRMPSSRTSRSRRRARIRSSSASSSAPRGTLSAWRSYLGSRRRIG